MEVCPPFTTFGYSTDNAFHGTLRSDAKSIWESKRFNPPDPSEDAARFGPGIYFWENSFRAATTWVRVFYRTDDYGVIRATLTCARFFDLLTTEHFDVLENTCRRIATQKRIPVTAVKHSAALKVLITAKLIDSARLIAGTSPKTRVHPDSRLAGPFEVILCVYEPMNIVVTGYADRSSSTFEH